MLLWLSKQPSPGPEDEAIIRSIAAAMVIPPVHLDHVGEAVCASIADEGVTGVVDTMKIRELTGWSSQRVEKTAVEH